MTVSLLANIIGDLGVGVEPPPQLSMLCKPEKNDAGEMTVSTLRFGGGVSLTWMGPLLTLMLFPLSGSLLTYNDKISIISDKMTQFSVFSNIVLTNTL